MELKYRTVGDLSAEDDGSNRTFMELKFILSIGNRVPTESSNRTFMELKFRSPAENMLPDTVLIAPLWN